MVKAVIFDFDGTICDSSEGIMSSALRTVEGIGYDTSSYSRDYLKRFIGPPLRDCFRITFSVPEDKIEECVAVYRKYYNEKGMFQMKPYPGIKELLYALKAQGIKTAVATNKMEELAVRCIHSQNMDDCFDVIKGPEVDGGITKAQVILNAISSLGVDKTEVVMVGDTSNDLNGAREAGVRFLGVSWGFGFSVSNEENLPLINEPYEILEKVMDINLKEKEAMIEKVDTPLGPKAVGPYSQAVKANGFMFVSGVLALDPVSGALVGETAEEQAKQIFKNAKAIISAGGGKIENTVKAVVYLKDINDFASVNSVYAEAFKDAPVLPARCAFEVAALPKGGKVEIEFTVAL